MSLSRGIRTRGPCPCPPCPQTRCRAPRPALFPLLFLPGPVLQASPRLVLGQLQTAQSAARAARRSCCGPEGIRIILLVYYCRLLGGTAAGGSLVGRLLRQKALSMLIKFLYVTLHRTAPESVEIEPLSGEESDCLVGYNRFAAANVDSVNKDNASVVGTKGRTVHSMYKLRHDVNVQMTTKERNMGCVQ